MLDLAHIRTFACRELLPDVIGSREEALAAVDYVDGKGVVDLGYGTEVTLIGVDGGLTE